jgi:hypothetical protein
MIYFQNNYFEKLFFIPCFLIIQLRLYENLKSISFASYSSFVDVFV